jgi:Rrf2 family protein
MKLSSASRYAVYALQYLGARPGEERVTAQHIAEAGKLSEAFLRKVLHPLVLAGLLRSVKGPNGGYRLARPASKITLLEVVEAVEGPIRGQAPLSDAPGEGRGGLDGRVQAVCDDVAALVRRQFGKVRLSGLGAAEERAGRSR